MPDSDYVVGIQALHEECQVRRLQFCNSNLSPAPKYGMTTDDFHATYRFRILGKAII